MIDYPHPGSVLTDVEPLRVMCELKNNCSIFQLTK